MLERTRKLLAKHLRLLADKFDAGTTDLSEEEAIELVSVITHIALSKEEACSYLNCSRATFDNAVRDGLLPKGRKIRGRKELIWFKDELSNVLKR